MKNSNLSFLLKTFFVTVFALIAFSAYAQNSFNVKVKFVDTNTNEGVAGATASLTVKGEEKPAKYSLTDENGAAEFTKVKKGTYIYKAEIMGYKTYEKEVVIEKNLDLGTIKLEEDIEVLDAAKVTDVGNPIIVKKDTIEYNASSFKTSENDMLEDLLKKLPGVEVGTDGSITANGETISKITIDGKTFFLDDPQLASKNLPAKMVEKVKVVERMSEQSRFTGIDDGNHEHIIDLSVQKGMMNGWFGNLMAGGGHDVPEAGYYNDEHSFWNEGWRYQGNGMIGNFKQDSQISIILNANNTNNQGATNMAGAMMGGMMGGMRGGRGGGGSGETSSWMTGLNGSFDLFDGDMELAGNYVYNGSNSRVKDESSKITYMENGSRLLSDDNGISQNSTQGHRFGIRMDHKFSETTSLLFEPQINFGSGTTSDFSDFATRTAMGADTTYTNKGFTSNNGNNNNWTTSGRILFRQRLGKAGRTMSINGNYNYSNNDMISYNRSVTMTKFDQDGNPILDPTKDIINQMYDQNSKSASLTGRFVYTEPLATNLYLEGSYQYSWSQSKSVKDAYNALDSKVDGTTVSQSGYDMNNPDPVYSSKIINKNIRHQAGVTLSYQNDKLNAQVGMRALPQRTINETNGESYDNSVTNWSPTARVRYQFTDYVNLDANYSGSSSQPSTSQLMAVPDNTNPLNISLGNPNLQPYFNHNARLGFGYTNRETFTSLRASFSGGMVQGAITNAQWYDNAGVQYSIPVNGPGTGNVSGSLMLNTPLGNSNFSIMSNTSARYNESTSYIGSGTLDSGKYYDPAHPDEFNHDAFHEDFDGLISSGALVINKTQSMNISENLRFTYRNDVIEVVASGRTNMSKSWYTIQAASQNTTWNNNVSMEVNWTLPFGMNLIANGRYNWYVGYTTQQDPEFVLNAEITQLLLNNTCTIALRGYDLLNQAKSLSVSDTSNYHQERRTNTLGRYVVLSFTYRFGTFGGRRGGSRGPGGMRGGAGGGRMMGPPMGGFGGGFGGGFRR